MVAPFSQLTYRLVDLLNINLTRLMSGLVYDPQRRLIAREYGDLPASDMRW